MMWKKTASSAEQYRSGPPRLRLSVSEGACRCREPLLAVATRPTRDLDLTNVSCCAHRAHILRAANALEMEEALRVRVRTVAWGAMGALLSTGFRYQLARHTPEETTFYVWRFLTADEQRRYHRTALAFDPAPRPRTAA